MMYSCVCFHTFAWEQLSAKRGDIWQLTSYLENVLMIVGTKGYVGFNGIPVFIVGMLIEVCDIKDFYLISLILYQWAVENRWIWWDGFFL